MSGEDQGDERKQTTDEVSKIYGRRQNWGLSVPQDKLVGEPADCPSGIRHRSGVTLIQALMWNVGTCRPDAKGEAQMRGPHKGESTDAGHRGGPTRISVEVSVMEMERRGWIIWPYYLVNQEWEEPKGKAMLSEMATG